MCFEVKLLEKLHFAPDENIQKATHCKIPLWNELVIALDVV